MSEEVLWGYFAVLWLLIGGMLTDIRADRYTLNMQNAQSLQFEAFLSESSQVIVVGGSRTVLVI
ncbi:hypothetical protein KS4_06280 [Poriferisphaera corsica]|uniref:Uncharacterized protein n=1 Tax=Poriferisphaera corsica TaxID=2528020 RepID=A0A517YQU3_9BACT|nr:hypothetical protein KS4_06280 [Poriferisphaera corsica]